MAENDSSRESMDEDADLLAAAADDEQRLQEATAESDGEASVGSKSESGSDYRAENGDDQPSGDEIGDLHHPDDDDDDEEASSSGEEELVPKKRQNRSRKIPEDVLRYAEQDCLRRSGRQRKEVQRLEVGQGSDSDEKPKRTRKRQKPDDWNGNSLSDSEDSSGSFVERRTVTRRPVNKRSKRKRGSSSDFDSDDSVPRRSIRKGKTSQVDYRDVDSDNGIDDDDVLEWQEEDSQTATVDGVAVETVERVLKHRLGRPTAIGHATTYYNVEERGDPNADFSATVSGETPERQYLIKWVGWSHMHNTWESEASLHLMNAKGMKKIENYVKRLREITEWRRNADKEYIEYFDCEQEMSEELCEQYKVVERVIAHQVSRERGTDSGTEYFVKWCGLPYSECTWEDSALIGRWYQKTIDAYHERSQSNRIPSKLCQALRRRPKFHKFETMPDFLLINDRNEQELRDYQLDGLNWLLRAWSKQNCSILADEMGLGKTIQSISFLSALYHFHDVYGPFLVVVPLSTMAAWQREFDNWAPDMNVIVYMGDVVSRDIIRQFEWYSPGTKRLKFNVVLTTYEILLKDKSFLGVIDWAVLAVDEAHRLKNDEALLYTSLSTFSTNHRLLITGTPLQNSLKELWALLHFIMPGEFQSWDEFEQQHKESDHGGFASLHEQLQPYLLRRVKKDVEKSLPAKVEQILRVDMTVQQKQYYKLILTKNYKELSKGVKGSINGFINLVMELKKCCNHATLIRAPDYLPNDAQGRLQQLLKASGKLILLDKLLCRLHETGHRVLIFSQMVMMLDILQEYLQLRRFPSQRLDGSMRSDLRKQALDHFNAPGSSDFCFLLSTRAGGLGINLATADTVIIFDSDWNPQNDLQAMSRAHRIGQKKQVNIYRLVTKASVEEEIVERAKQKLVLDHLVIQRMDTTGKTVLSKNAVTGSSGSVPFDKQELSAILKFGAEELFKEKEGDEDELEVDIDNILQGAETRECDNQEQASDLLSAFKYANFAIDEEKDLAQLDQRHKTSSDDTTRPEKDWEEIIPETERKKIEEEERQQLEADLFLGPRQRNKVQQMARGEDSDDDWDKSRDSKKKRKRPSADSGAETPSDESDDDRPRAGGRKKKVLFSFSEAEIRKFVKSFRKFGKPLTRLEAVAQDAELEDHSTAELKLLAEELIKKCQEAAREYEKNPPVEKKVGDDGKKKQDRGPVCKLGGIDVYVRPMMKVQSDLEPLDVVMPKDPVEWKHFRVPGKPRPQKGWDVEWDEADDSALLRGVFQYGMGSWEAIKMDPDLGLVEKIWLKDKNKKPQAKHIQSRAEYLLKYLAKHTDVNRARVRTNKSATIDGAITAVLSDAKKAPKKQQPPAKPKEKKEKERETKKREVEEGEIESEKPTKGFKRDSKPKKVEKPLFTAKTDHMVVNSKKYGSDLQSSSGKQFQECIQAMRPVQKAIRKLVKSGELLSTAEAMRNLLKVGDHIEEYLADQATKSASKATLDKWHSYLWIFLSRFIEPFQEPNDLLHQYRAAVKTRNDNPDLLVESSSHHHHHHNSSKHHDKEKDKEKEREREREKDKPHHSHPNTSSTSKASSSDHHRHRDRNERSSSSTTREGYRRDERPTNSHRYNDQPNPLTNSQSKRKEGGASGARSPTSGWSHTRYTEPRYQQPRSDRGYNDPPVAVPNPLRQQGQSLSNSPWKSPVVPPVNAVNSSNNNNHRDWRR